MELFGYWFTREDRFVSIEEAERNFDKIEQEGWLRPLYRDADSSSQMVVMPV